MPGIPKSLPIQLQFLFPPWQSLCAALGNNDFDKEKDVCAKII